MYGLVAAALLFAVRAIADESPLDRAYADVVATRAVLERALDAKRAGEEPLPGERLGVAAPSGAATHSRLSDAYWQRQQRLAKDVEEAQKSFDAALQRWNGLK